jgi:hypothetical protein
MDPPPPPLAFVLRHLCLAVCASPLCFAIVVYPHSRHIMGKLKPINASKDLAMARDDWTRFAVLLRDGAVSPAICAICAISTAISIALCRLMSSRQSCTLAALSATSRSTRWRGTIASADEISEEMRADTPPQKSLDFYF